MKAWWALSKMTADLLSDLTQGPGSPKKEQMKWAVYCFPEPLMMSPGNGDMAFGKLVDQIIKVPELIYPKGPFISHTQMFSEKSEAV